MTSQAPDLPATLSPARPLPITLLCLGGWILIGVVAFVSIVARWEAFRALPLARSAAGALTLAAGAAILGGYWGLRRWGLWLALAAALLRLAAGALGWLPLTIEALAWPALLVVAGLLFARRLR